MRMKSQDADHRENQKNNQDQAVQFLEFSNHELASQKDKLIIGGQVEAKDERSLFPIYYTVP